MRVSSRNSGWFFTRRLPPGEYKVLSILPSEIKDRVVEPTPLRFTVPESGKAYFIGTLIIDWKVVSKEYTGFHRLEIKNEIEEMKSILVKNNDFWSDKVERSLINIDDSFRLGDVQIIDRNESQFKLMNTSNENMPPAPTF